MDALSEVLRLARFSAQVTLDAAARSPWCVSVPASGLVARAHLVLEGECSVQPAQGEALALRAGEIAWLPHGDAHLIGSSFEPDAVSFATLVRTPVAGELVPVRLGGNGAAVRWVSIATSCERHLAEPLMGSLPAVFKVDLLGAPALNWLTGALGLHLSASD
ncbi:MAG TPA: cupin domain-containing protein, partial [Usitatibacter sp.]|nr:cupin domain-containing protein [Usitatibacter sp.]